MRFAVAHASRGVTYVVRGTGIETMPEVIRLTADPSSPIPKKKRQKLEFLEALTPVDEVFLELGGGDRLALAALAFGAKVRRYPTYKLGVDDCAAVVADEGWQVQPEKPRGEESGDDLTARKTRALALFALSYSEPEEFVTPGDVDLSILVLKVRFRSFRRAQKLAARSVQGLLAAYRDQAFIEIALARQKAAKAAAEDIYNFMLEQVLADMIGGEVSDEARADFLAAVGRVFGESRIPEHATEEQITELVEQLIASDKFHATVFARLKNQEKAIERLLKGGREKAPGAAKSRAVPANEIWTTVFEPVMGCGPRIAAPIISTVVDIRRFESFAAFKAYGGYHQFKDGSRAHRIKGHAAPWSMSLKQAVYNFAVQTVKTPASPWRARLDARKAFELWKILSEREAAARSEGHDVSLLPDSFRSRSIASVMDTTPADYAVLAAHVDALRKLAGVAAYSDEEDADEPDEAPSVAKDPKLAKLTAGVKGQAHDRGLRWLGQMFLKHIYKEWRRAIGLSELPVREKRDRTSRAAPVPVSEAGA